MSFFGCEHTVTSNDCNVVKYTHSLCVTCQEDLIKELNRIRIGIRQNPNAFAYVTLGLAYESKNNTQYKKDWMVRLFLTDLLAFMRVINCTICHGACLFEENVSCKCMVDTYNTPEC